FRILDGRPHCAAAHYRPARPCPKTHPRWHWPKGWRGDGVANTRGPGDLWSQVRSCRRAVASCLLCSIKAEPGTRKEISRTAESAQGEPRSFAERKGRSGTGSCTSEVGCSDERFLWLPEEHHSAHPRAKRQQRRDYLYGELVHPPAEP